MIADMTANCPDLALLFDQWRHVHHNYVRKNYGANPDCLWWSEERANIGALLGAASRLDWACAQEFNDPRIIDNHRGDLWFRAEPSGRSFCVEAKFSYFDADHEDPGAIC